MNNDTIVALSIIDKIDRVTRATYKSNLDRLIYLNKNLPKLMSGYDTRLAKNVDLKLFRGYASELIMTTILEVLKDYKNVFIKEGIIIPTTDDNKTTQLDHLILTPNAGILIEVKHVYGDIYISNGELTQKYDGKSVTIKPWNQNMYHIFKLKEFLGVPRLYMHNMVFIYGDYKIRGISLEDNRLLLEYKNSVPNLINIIESNVPYEISLPTMRKCIEKINRLDTVDINTHIKNVRR